MKTQALEIVIASRFCGPSQSGNGGYTCGRLAALIRGDACEVTLRAPPPLDTPLRVEWSAAGLRLWHQDQLIAEAKPTELELNPPTPPSWTEAQGAERSYRGLIHHDFPRCFTCGTQREPGDGLRVFTGPIEGKGIVAASWIASAGDAEHGGRVPGEVLWASIDCAGAWATQSRSNAPSVLGRMAGRFYRHVTAGQRCIVLGWALGSDGRKHHAGTALFSADGELLGCAKQTWIEIRAT
jgi:hypothetical protein